MRAERLIHLEFVSHLDSSASEVWSTVSTMDGVNAELRPWMTMTHPAELGQLDDPSIPIGTELFRSWLLAGGFVPIDRHRLVLDRVIPGVGFDEESSSWMQRRWRHERRVVPMSTGGCSVSDVLVVDVRVTVLRPIVARIVKRLLEHRHRQLRKRFGEPNPTKH